MSFVRLSPLRLRSLQAGVTVALLVLLGACSALPDRPQRPVTYDFGPGVITAPTAGADKPLPALRMLFDDPHGTWVHIDPHTGAVLGRTDSHRRTSRWLFAMLHSWDWLPLLERRPLWDVLLIVLSLGGAVMSLTGVVIGWRRLGIKLQAPPAHVHLKR